MRSEIETIAPNLDELRGGLPCFRGLLRDLEPSDVVRDLASRFEYIAECANRRIEVGRVLREVPPHIRLRLLAESASLAEAAASARATELGPDAFWNRDALDDALTSLAQTQIRDRGEFKHLVEVEASKLQANDAVRLRRIFRDVATGLGHTGIEQGESMRSARAEVLELVGDTAGERSALGWLLLGWLCLWNSAYCADAINHFSQGIIVTGDSRNYLSHLLQRFLGVALEASGRQLEALDAAKTAMTLRPSADVALEASRYAIQCGRVAEAKQLFETAARQESMLIFSALADPDMAGLELAIVNEYAAAGTHMRQSALRAIEGWQATITRVRAAETCLGEIIEVPFELADGLDEMRALALKSEMLEAIGVRSAAKKIASDLYQFVLRRISSIVGQRESEAAAARHQVSDSVSKRESVKHNAEAQAEAVIAATEAELRQLGTGGASSSALGNAIGGSFAMLMVYVVAAGMMGPRGIDTSFDSPFGMAGACLIAAPLILGFGSCAAGGVKQAALESEIQRRAKYARRKAKATLIEVEKSIVRQAEGSKTAASSLEERAKAATEALRVLRQDPMADLHSASRLAA